MGVGIYYSTLELDKYGAGFGIRANLSRDFGYEERREIKLTIRAAISAAGGCGYAEISARNRPTAFNRQMEMIADGYFYEVGLMGWQHDYVVEVGGCPQEHESLLSLAASDIRDTYGMSPIRFERVMNETFQNVSRYLQLSIMLDLGLSMQVLSGGYIPRCLPMPPRKQAEAERQRLMAWLLRRRNSLLPARADKPPKKSVPTMKPMEKHMEIAR